jgi:hypothetical protein
MKNFSFGFKSPLFMKKIILFAIFALAMVASKAQVTVAYALDSLDNPLYGDIYLMDDDESIPFYIIVDDTKPVTCNKFKVKAYFRDYTNGKKTDDYWIYQGEFEFPITPNFYGYWLQMNAFTVGEYKIEVNGYLNSNYMKYFGSTTFDVYSEDDFWDWWF